MGGRKSVEADAVGKVLRRLLAAIHGIWRKPEAAVRYCIQQLGRLCLYHWKNRDQERWNPLEAGCSRSRRLFSIYCRPRGPATADRRPFLQRRDSERQFF